MYDVVNKVKEVISEQLAVKLDKVENKNLLVEDFDCDELDLVELSMALDDEFELDINYTDFKKLKTVGEVIDFVTYHLAIKQEKNS